MRIIEKKNTHIFISVDVLGWIPHSEANMTNGMGRVEQIAQIKQK